MSQQERQLWQLSLVLLGHQMDHEDIDIISYAGVSHMREGVTHVVRRSCPSPPTDQFVEDLVPAFPENFSLVLQQLVSAYH